MPSHCRSAAGARRIDRRVGSAIALGADLSVSSAVDGLAADVKNALSAEGFSHLDIRVNNAGVAEFVGFTKTTGETSDRTFAINIKAPYRLTAALAGLIPDGGRIVFVTTAVTCTDFPRITAYAASKGAVDVLIRYLAAEFGPRGIRVTGVALGAIATDMSAWLQSVEGEAQAHLLQALKSIGAPADIASVIAFLAGPDGAWITGGIVTASVGTKR